MTVDVVKSLSAEVFKTILLASGPILLVSLFVGLVVSLFQAVTQIQEFTLTFVPKIVAVFICLFVFFPWIARVLTAFTTNLIEKIPVLIR
ncbi:MAG TPA: flagellar biosynthesis protein FliQ [Thermodesulfovibrionales bacterium]|jgi:flagellar biosynthetic protein FliQ|nr:flagellar biosynthesis protein FliQ [Thermodesulfovibrionales bacterium]